MDTVQDNPLALKYFDFWRAGVIENEEIEKKAERRLAQNQHLLTENAQLHKELRQLREGYVLA